MFTALKPLLTFMKRSVASCQRIQRTGRGNQYYSAYSRSYRSHTTATMPSSKGTPTDPELREQLKEEIQQETNKDGSGAGKWSAWKGAKLAKEYEAQGGEYENQAGSKNEPKKGAPHHKSEAKKKAELEDDE
ncbi:hypothetical protein DL546_008831 [Coniochaeta pulveracea]|uniref:Uncharacterized protein n=1 Tax=Coniochaeta pulveracea TaxID=177199 RepID=A0A420YMS7_9PEZI|nr:hypothetical protein DL546_008831 [Coniochaeta pulveracea]